MPKKPLTPYFRFFMAKRQKYSAKHPKMGVTDLTKELSKKYANLSEKKKVRIGIIKYLWMVGSSLIVVLCVRIE